VGLVLLGDRAASSVAAGVFVVGAATDGLDGYLARRYRSTSRTGQWLDPLADKVFVAAPVLALAAVGTFPAWAAAVIVAREVGVSLLRAYLGLRGVPFPASGPAKVKTTAQLVAVTLYILPLGEWARGLRLAALVPAVVLTVGTGLQYAGRARTALLGEGARR
jgi:CDP-diacylglycerol--glycerol-3-phosphate 3-phosphatidyltransferase